jgi:hypothetical protein
LQLSRSVTALHSLVSAWHGQWENPPPVLGHSGRSSKVLASSPNGYLLRYEWTNDRPMARFLSSLDNGLDFFIRVADADVLGPDTI